MLPRLPGQVSEETHGQCMGGERPIRANLHNI